MAADFKPPQTNFPSDDGHLQSSHSRKAELERDRDASEETDPRKRQKVAHDLPAPYFRSVPIESSEPASIQSVVHSFNEKFPNVSRIRLADVAEKAVISDRFIVAHVVISQGRQVLMSKKRWRLIIREAFEDGMFGDQIFLTIFDYIPNMENMLPKEFKSRTDYRDMEYAPLLVMSGFCWEKNKLTETRMNLLCTSENAPRIILGVPKKRQEHFFVSELTQPPKPVPFASLLAPTLAEFVHLKDMKPGQRSNVIGAITYSYHTPRTTRGSDFMFLVTIIDSSLYIQANEKVAVYMFCKDPEKLPQVRNLGDVILLKNFRYYRHADQRQLKGNIGGESGFLLVHKDGDFNANTKCLSVNERNFVKTLMEWYDKEAAHEIAKHAPEGKEPWRPPNLAKFADDLKNGVPLLSQKPEMVGISGDGSELRDFFEFRRTSVEERNAAPAAKGAESEVIALDDDFFNSNTKISAVVSRAVRHTVEETLIVKNCGPNREPVAESVGEETKRKDAFCMIA